MDNKIRDIRYINIKKLVNMSLFISISILLSIIEAMLPISFLVPGIKLGLANIILVLLIFNYSLKDLIVFQFVKITVTTFILGVFSVYLFSLSGGMLALFIMYTFKKVFGKYVTIYTISVLGSVAHAVGQTLFAAFYLKTSELILYIPFLVIFGCISGLAIGHIAFKIQPSFERKLNDNRV
ncbi:MAG: Gx transporter family protein [Mycoplasmatales bacterium]